MKGRRAAIVALLSAGLWSTSGSAAGPLGPNDSPLTTSQYRVDLTQGVVLAGSRVLGMAGAYVAIAEGVDGSSQNPAAPAVRLPYSFDHFDYDLGLGLTFPGAISGTDFYNSGQRTALRSDQTGFAFITVAGHIQDGNWGFGISLDFQRYRLTRIDDASSGLQLDEVFALFGGARIQIARRFFDGQLVVGAGSRGTGLLVQNENPAPGQPAELFNATGAALELGTLWAPHNQRFRVGAAVRSEVLTGEPSSDAANTTNGDRVIGDPTSAEAFYLPEKVTLPWDLNVGVAIQLGPRPLNPRWVDPSRTLEAFERHLAWRDRERERRREYAVARARLERQDETTAAAAADATNGTEEAMDELALERRRDAVRRKLRARYEAMRRFYILVSGSVLVTGPVKNGVGVESFLQRRVDRSGEDVTVSPRLGIESEIVPHWLKVRGGGYGEPTRFERGSPRLHGTLGFDLKLFPWTVFGLFEDGTQWRVSSAIDGAKRYFGWGVSAGVWH